MPLNVPWDQNDPKQIIEVEDDGNGMTWEMVRDAYLDVGRDRRLADGKDKSPGGRPLQGRKGVGTLAGFGVADTLEVQTVYKDRDPAVRAKVLIWFSLALADLQEVKRGPAPVNLIFAGPITKAPAGGRKTKGTTVILRQLHDRRAQNSKRFQQSMAERFLFVGAQFRVRFNGKDLRPEVIKTQWRWPESGWASDNVQGCGPVSYWIGFTRVPRKQNEGELSGILIYTRQKISQEATFFDISGGVTGQHGLRYMVGMIRAEWLDVGVSGPDYIATPRDSIAWESPQGAAFKEWGQELVRKYLKEWARLRARSRVTQIKKVHPSVIARINRLSEAYKDVALQFVDKFKSVEMEPEEFEDILSWFLDALENATLRSILEKLRSSDAKDLEGLDELLSKMEVRTAVTLLQIIDSNLAAIETLERMHLTDARERGVISRHLETNAWLIDPTWMLNKSEGRVSTWIKQQFGLEPTGKSGDTDRADFFCVAVGGTLHIVEIKRGAYVAKSRDIEQAEKYRLYVLQRFSEISDPKAIKYANVQSHLIAANLRSDANSIKQAYADKGWVFFTTWSDLIERAKLTHHQFRNALKKRASETEEAAPTVASPASEGRRRKLKKRKQKK